MAAQKARGKKAPAKKSVASKKVAKRPAARKSPAKNVAPKGHSPVDAYYADLPAWQREVTTRVDALVRREVPAVKREIKWGVPNYGTTANGWFCACAGFSKHVKVNFFKGVGLKPVPPQGSGKEMRSIDYRGSDEVDERQLAAWVRQAAAMPGMGGAK